VERRTKSGSDAMLPRFQTGNAGGYEPNGHTPRSVVRVLVVMLEPYKGRVYDPCCGFRDPTKYPSPAGAALANQHIFAGAPHAVSAHCSPHSSETRNPCR
jgi:hypothetical protein